jgi:CRISPR/Cas system endoribonuclease Cas6 (RAMP superfamily)
MGAIRENIGVCKYELWARLAVMKRKKAAGFVGWVTYEVKDKESEWNRVKCMLDKYAEFA